MTVSANPNSIPFISLVDCDDHKMDYLPGSSDRLVVSFSGVGSKRDQMPGYEFIGSASDGGRNHVLLVSERRRTWMNDTALSQAIVTEVEKIVAQEDIQDVVSIGNSMGGFMALVLPQLTRVTCAIAFSPQYSMHPDHVPEESRWQYWRNRFPGFTHETIGPLDTDACDYYIFHGDAAVEEVHWGRFPVNPALNHFILKGVNHNLVKSLKQQRMLGRLIRLAIHRKPQKLRVLLQSRFDATRRDRIAADIPAGDDTRPE